MATRTAVRISPPKDSHHGPWIGCVWSGLQPGDDGEPWQMFGYGDRSIQVAGNFGAGGTLLIEGSNDGVNFVPLTDDQGAALAFNGGALKIVIPLARYVRPRITAGTGVDLTCTLIEGTR